MYKSGANFADRNLIKSMLTEGELTHEQIRALTSVNLKTIAALEAEFFPPDTGEEEEEEDDDEEDDED